MRYVPLKEAEPGMVLAADLYDSVGRTLIGCHCELTESYLEKLEAYGFDGVYIEDKLSEGITIESVITPQLRQEGQERIRACDIDGCKLIARRMVEEILSCGNVSLDLTDLRSYDDYTYAHSVNVAVYCGVIGMGMGMSEVELGHLVTAALLHDLGKLQIPDEILNPTQHCRTRLSVSGGIFLRISKRPCCITMKMWTEADTRTGWKARSRRCLPGFCTWRMSMMHLRPGARTRSHTHRTRRQSI